jgi:hypothetical protein
MAKNPKPKADDPEQSKRFIETAKELGTDEDPNAFDRAFKAVAQKRPVSSSKTRRSASPAGGKSD